MPAESLAHKPAALDWTIAGALALAGQTAHDAFASQRVGADDVVLVSAAAGGVGLTIAQLAVRAKAHGYRHGIETHHDFLRELGVIPVSYGPGLAERVRVAAPRPVTVVFDNHGAETIEAAIELGVPRHRINSIATDPAEYGVVRVGRGADQHGHPRQGGRSRRLRAAGGADRGAYPLSEVVAAYEHLERGHLRGKIVIVAD